jgi:hypothetical protein
MGRRTHLKIWGTNYHKKTKLLEQNVSVKLEQQR